MSDTSPNSAYSSEILILPTLIAVALSTLSNGNDLKPVNCAAFAVVAAGRLIQFSTQESDVGGAWRDSRADEEAPNEGAGETSAPIDISSTRVTNQHAVHLRIEES